MNGRKEVKDKTKWLEPGDVDQPSSLNAPSQKSCISSVLIRLVPQLVSAAINLAVKLTSWHLIVWLTFASVAAGMSVWVCVGYNEVAGTDKTPDHIALIAAAVMTGPMVGPVANSAATGERQLAITVTAVLFCGLLISLLPFCLVKRPASKAILVLSWSGFVIMSALWFFSSMLSLAVHLS